MARGPEMPFFPRIPTGLLYLFVVFFLTLQPGLRAAAQDPLPKPAEEPAGPVFPSALPTSDKSEGPQAADPTGPSPKLAVGDLLEVSVDNVPDRTTTGRFGTHSH